MTWHQWIEFSMEWPDGCFANADDVFYSILDKMNGSLQAAISLAIEGKDCTEPSTYLTDYVYNLMNFLGYETDESEERFFIPYWYCKTKCSDFSTCELHKAREM